MRRKSSEKKELWSQYRVGIVSCAFTAVFWLDHVIGIYSVLQRFQHWLIAEFDFFVTILTLFFALLLLCVAVTAIELLTARRFSPITGQQELRFNRPRTRLMIVATVPLAVVLGCLFSYLTWSNPYYPMIPPNAIAVYIDDFTSKGWEDTDFATRVEKQLRHLLAETVPSMKLLSLAPPPDYPKPPNLREWACRTGALVVLGGKADKYRIWPEIYSCSRGVMGDVFDPIEVSIGVNAGDSIRSSLRHKQLLDSDQPTMHCVIDTLLPQRIEYLASFLLGRAFFVGNWESLTAEEEYRIAASFFETCVEIGKGGRDCLLNYCQALNYLGHSKLELSRIHIERPNKSKLLLEALELFEAAVHREPSMSPAWLGRGIVYSERGNYAEAISSYDSALYYDSLLSEAWNNRGNCLESVGRVEDALQSYRFAIEANSSNWVAWNNLSGVLVNQHSLVEALTASDSAMHYSNSALRPMINRSSILGQMGRLDDARELINRALSVNSRLPAAWLSLSMSLAKADSLSAAISATDSAISLDSSYFDAWLARADYYYDLKNFENAKRSAEVAVSIRPESHRAWMQLGFAQLFLREYRSSDQSLAKSLDLRPKNAYIWFFRALSLRQTGPLETALDYCDSALQLSPSLEMARELKDEISRLMADGNKAP